MDADGFRAQLRRRTGVTLRFVGTKCETLPKLLTMRGSKSQHFVSTDTSTQRIMDHRLNQRAESSA